MKRICKLHIALLILFSFSGVQIAIGQCSQLTKEEMVRENGLDAILIDDYNVKLKDGTIKRPIRTKRIDVFLEANILYRFSLFSANESDRDAVIQLYDHRELLGSTFDDITKTDLDKFEFMTEEALSLQLVFSSKKGNKICATALFSMVLQDTTTIMDSRVGEIEENSLETLYAGINNPIEIAASGVDGGYLEVSISEGKIEGDNGTYVATVSKLGIVNIKVRSYESDSTLHEESNTPFMVRKIPDPKLKLAGVANGNVSLSILKNLNDVALDLLPGIHQGNYQLIEFGFAKGAADIKIYKSNGNQVTNRQKSFINSLKKGDEFYVKEAKVLTPEGKTIILATSRFKAN